METAPYPNAFHETELLLGKADPQGLFCLLSWVQVLLSERSTQWVVSRVLPVTSRRGEWRCLGLARSELHSDPGNYRRGFHVFTGVEGSYKGRFVHAHQTAHIHFIVCKSCLKCNSVYKFILSKINQHGQKNFTNYKVLWKDKAIVISPTIQCESVKFLRHGGLS